MKGSQNKGTQKGKPGGRSMKVHMDNPNVQRPIPSGELNVTVRVGRAGKGRFKCFR